MHSAVGEHGHVAYVGIDDGRWQILLKKTNCWVVRILFLWGGLSALPWPERTRHLRQNYRG